jgi:transketolase
MNEGILFLEYVAYQMRRWSIRMTSKAGSGHVSSSLSAADIIAALFFDVMHFDPDQFENPNNDRFILSKGHAAPILYAAWHELGKLTDQEVLSYRMFGSVLEGHPTLRFAYAEAATGSLGIGLSIGVGEALAAKQAKRDYRTFVLMGDSEVSEGSVWEAAQLATYYKLNNIIGIIDCNRLGQSTPTMQALEGDGPERFKIMFEAFGWQSEIVDGHDMQALVTVLHEARMETDQPVMIIARTKKGFGAALIEDKEGFHGKALKPEQEKQALEQLRERFADADAYSGGCKWKAKQPSKGDEPKKQTVHMPSPEYKKGEEIPTRKAYGQSLVALGGVCQEVVSLDGEVKNSTYAELFEKAYPDRFYQCFIAEQNMIGMGVGFNRRGFIPFISTFASFFSRAHDQLRMAAIGQASLRLAGSHAGVSIGQDGPSQMGLEDIAMMRGLPESIVLYPCDAVSTYKLINEMANHHESISYVRTTRMATPIIYDATESFPIGGCKVLKQSSDDQVLVIGAGVTLFEALKAHEELAKEGKSIAVIDLYSIKPLDVQTIISVARACKNRIITVEDHYPQGGIGEAVAAAVSTEKIEVYQLAVTHLPRSGQPDELLADAGINAEAIIKIVKQL